MNFHQPEEENELLREADGAGAEIARAVRISLCGIDLGQPASFVPASIATAEFDWQQWLRGVFAESLGGAFVEIYQAAGQMHVREAFDIDNNLNTVVGETSRSAGALLFQRLVEAKRLPVVDKFRRLLADGSGPNFFTAFAIECAEFHLTLRSAIISYLYGEWRCGMAALGQRGDLDAFAAGSGEEVIRAVEGALSQGSNPFQQAAQGN